MLSLGIMKTEAGDYGYIDQRENLQAKNKLILCKNNVINTVEGKYKIMVCEKASSKNENQ